MQKDHILITGGTGFIGSHCCVELIQKGYNVILLDNLSNSSIKVLDHIHEISGVKPIFHEVDIKDYDRLFWIFEQYSESLQCVVHCAALKSVAESFEKPLEYYENNVIGTINILKAMNEFGCKNIVFSSSATVYGNSETVPITEKNDTKAINPYGRTKLYVEELLKDIARGDHEWRVCILRYFNPVGAHESGKLGENPKGLATNLVPHMLRVACGIEEKVTVFGGDYETPDGTCIRDYIHVMDLARGHEMAISMMCNEIWGEKIMVLNLGTGVGYSVLEMIKMMRNVSGKEIHYVIGDRREGDSMKCYADVKKAWDVLGWKAEKGLKEMCEDSWRWFEKSYKSSQDMDYEKPFH